MQIDPAEALNRPTGTQNPEGRSPVGGADNFAAELQRFQPEQVDEAREAAKQWVGIAFFQPLLEQMENDPLRTELFHGGYGEKVWSRELNSVLRERMAEASSFDLADVIVDRLMKPEASPPPVMQGQGAPDGHGSDGGDEGDKGGAQRLEVTYG